MSKIRPRKETGTLYYDFKYLGKRCREQTTLEDTPENWQVMQTVLNKIDNEITLGTFVYEKYFPKGKMSVVNGMGDAPVTAPQIKPSVVTPTLLEFSELFFSENEVRCARRVQG